MKSGCLNSTLNRLFESQFLPSHQLVEIWVHKLLALLFLFTLTCYSCSLIYLAMELLFLYLPCHDTLVPLLPLPWHSCSYLPCNCTLVLIYLDMLLLFLYLPCNGILVPLFTLSWHSCSYLPCHDTLVPLFTLSWHSCSLIYFAIALLFLITLSCHSCLLIYLSWHSLFTLP